MIETGELDHKISDLKKPNFVFTARGLFFLRVYKEVRLKKKQLGWVATQLRFGLLMINGKLKETQQDIIMLWFKNLRYAKLVQEY